LPEVELALLHHWERKSDCQQQMLDSIENDGNMIGPDYVNDGAGIVMYVHYEGGEEDPYMTPFLYCYMVPNLVTLILLKIAYQPT
jgi:hypothetical protein